MDEALNLPLNLLDDDNREEAIALPAGARVIPVTSAPHYTLYRLVRHLRPNAVLEIGTQRGGSAMTIAYAMRDNGMPVDVTCVDPFFPTGDNDGLPSLQEWYQNISSTGLKPGIDLLMSTSGRVLPNMARTFDLVFVDGSHEYLNVREDCYLALSLLSTGGYFVAHDYVFYESVRKGCDEVINRFSLPHHVNRIQKNYRGDLCGWVIARKNADIPDAEIARHLRAAPGRHRAAFIRAARKNTPRPLKRLFRRILNTVRES